MVGEFIEINDDLIDLYAISRIGRERFGNDYEIYISVFGQTYTYVFKNEEKRDEKFYQIKDFLKNR